MWQRLRAVLFGEPEATGPAISADLDSEEPVILPFHRPSPRLIPDFVNPHQGPAPLRLYDPDADYGPSDVRAASWSRGPGYYADFYPIEWRETVVCGDGAGI